MSWSAYFQIHTLFFSALISIPRSSISQASAGLASGIQWYKAREKPGCSRLSAFVGILVPLLWVLIQQLENTSLHGPTGKARCDPASTSDHSSWICGRSLLSTCLVLMFLWLWGSNSFLVFIFPICEMPSSPVWPLSSFITYIISCLDCILSV